MQLPHDFLLLWPYPVLEESFDLTYQSSFFNHNFRGEKKDWLSSVFSSRDILSFFTFEVFSSQGVSYRGHIFSFGGVANAEKLGSWDSVNGGSYDRWHVRSEEI